MSREKINITVRKKIVFSLLAGSLFFILAEAVTRLAGFEYIPFRDDFEITPEYRLFERKGKVYSTAPSKLGSFVPQEFPADKSSDEYRIALLGGSSINYLGDIGHLKAGLAEKYPGKKFTLINVGGIGYGTTRLLLHLQEVIQYRPDLVILYSGHNEFTEDYIRGRYYNYGFFEKWHDRLVVSSRFYALFAYAGHKLAEKKIEMAREKRHPFFTPEFAFGWEEEFDRDEIYREYRRNIVEITGRAREAGIDIVICTVSYNRMEATYNVQKTDYNKGQGPYQEGDYTKALYYFEKGIDQEPHPLRATETSNGIVKEVAARYAIPLVDVDGIIKRDYAVNGIPGPDLFDDHCHLNKKGNLILQQILLEAIGQGGFVE